MEQLLDCLLLLEVGLAGLGLPWRPALAMHLDNSWHNSFIHPSCCQWGSTLGATTHSPSKLVQQFLVFSHLWTLKGSRWKDSPGPSLQSSQLVGLGSPFSTFLLMEAALWSRHSSKKRCHSCHWVVLQPGCSPLNSLRYS